MEKERKGQIADWIVCIGQQITLWLFRDSNEWTTAEDWFKSNKRAEDKEEDDDDDYEEIEKKTHNYVICILPK